MAVKPTSQPATRPPAGPRRLAGPEVELVPTRDELYAEARTLGVPGRSRMTRDELARAVREARGSS